VGSILILTRSAISTAFTARWTGPCAGPPEGGRGDPGAELETILEKARDGSLFRTPPFDSVPDPSGAWPTLLRRRRGAHHLSPLREVAARWNRLKKKLGLEGLKIAVLTNCTLWIGGGPGGAGAAGRQ